MRHFLTLKEYTGEEIKQFIIKSMKIKENPDRVRNKLRDKTLLMIFQKPSLRTRVSFEAGMTKLGGHAIYYDTSNSPLGRGESIHDTAMCASRYADIISARLFAHKDIEELAEHSRVPVINMLTNFAHPCQILADLMTIQEKKGRLKGLTLAFLGDGNNNVTHSLLFGCSKTGINILVASPEGYAPRQDVADAAMGFAAKNSTKVVITQDPKEAVRGADVIVTDTWMSYHIPEEQKQERVMVFSPYQVSREMMALGKKDAIFMHCLPGYRGYEVTSEVIDGAQSAVFDEAENRLWTEMAIILELLEKG